MRFKEILEDPDRPLSTNEYSIFINMIERIILTIKNNQLHEQADHAGNGALLSKDQIAALKGLMTMPDISMNKSNGSPYAQMRFMLAMAGAPDITTGPSGAAAGDPMVLPYSKADMEIIQSAIGMVGAGRILPMTDNHSSERDDTYTTSPVANWMNMSEPKKVEPKVLK